MIKTNNKNIRSLKKALAVFFSIAILFSMLSAVPAYAQEQSVKAERNIQKSLSVAENRLQRVAAGSIISVSTYEELVSALESKISNIYILQDLHLESALQVNYDVSFLADNTGITLFSSENNRHIVITASDVQIQFDNVILQGQAESNIRGGGIEAVNVTNISLISPVIQNCYADRNFSIILNELEESLVSNFSIYNGIIRNNKIRSGCAIDTYANDVVIYNTRIENNESIRKTGYCAIGLGFDEEAGTTASIYNSVISNNALSEGAGINIYNTNLFLNKNTVIENNTATKSGGAIYAADSTIESYATITHNTASEYGGGIALDNSKLIIQGGEISYNSAGMNVTNLKHYGGGIAISGNNSGIDNVVLNDGVIKGNTSIIGAGIGYDFMSNYNAENQPRVIINGGTICNNGYTVEEDGTLSNICSEGGGIYGSYVEMNDGTIEQNICNGLGAGIEAQNLVMQDGLIQDNGYYENEAGEISVQTAYGGGIYIYKSANITGGLIYSNQAIMGGGIAAYGKLSLNSPAYVRYNIATTSGGGVYFYRKDCVDNVDYTRIRNNTAPDGAQYYLK